MASNTKFSVFRYPDNIKNRYRRLALISHPAHLELVDFDDSDTLIVCTDWLVWRKCVDAGGHSLHFEAMLQTWPKERGDSDARIMRACQWMYINERDVTIFLGVSLGKQFNKDLSLLSHAYLRMWHALDRFCKTFEPEEIIFFDIRAERNLLDEDAKLDIVGDIAARHRILLTDMGPRLSDDQSASPESGLEVTFASENGLRAVLRGAYETAVDTVSAVRSFFSARPPRILFLNNWLTVKNLIGNFEGNLVRPVFLAGGLPKSPRFIGDCFRRGIFLAKLPRVGLNFRDRQSVDKIITDLNQAWVKPGSGLQEVQRRYIRRHVIAKGRLHKRAREIKRFQNLFKRHRFSRVVVGDVENQTCRLIVEIATGRSVATDENLNGMFFSHQHQDARSGDDCHPGFVTRLLAWGPQNVKWLAATNPAMECICTGYPALDGIRKMQIPSSSGNRNILVLPLLTDVGDALGIHANIFTYLVDIVSALQSSNYNSIRIKVHSGEWNKKYYEAVLRHCGFNCEVYQEGPLLDHILWADIVVGPINSGSFVETMAVGKPYYPILATPSSLRREHFGGANVFSTMPELIAAIQQNDNYDQSSVFENFCSIESIPNASRKVWEVLEESV